MIKTYMHDIDNIDNKFDFVNGNIDIKLTIRRSRIIVILQNKT